MTRTVISALALTALSAIPSQAAPISFDLNCIVGQGDPQCGVPSYGTVTFDDSPGNGAIQLTVELTIGEKFKDLLFNYNGPAVAITAGSDMTNLLNPDRVSHAPYRGKFDVGALGGDDPFTTITLYGWDSTWSNVTLLLPNFQVLDTLDQTYLAVHIQNIGPDGESMNAVGSNGPSGSSNAQSVPEPASLVLFVGGLLFGAARIRRRQK